MEEINRYMRLVEEVKKNITEIDAESVHQFIVQDNPFYLIDVRDENDYNEGHLPGAIHINRGVIEVKIEKTIPNVSDEIVVYCGGGSRSVLVAENLQRMGYKNIKALQDGFRGWLATGYEIERN